MRRRQQRWDGRGVERETEGEKREGEEETAGERCIKTVGKVGVAN